MGYSYGRSGSGRLILSCDQCGHAGGCRKVPCKYGYCPASALCASCRKDPAVKAAVATHCEENCKQGAADFAAREAQKTALLASGAFLRVSASAKGDMVAVTFRNRHDETVVHEVTPEEYDAIPLLTPATPTDYGLLRGV